MADQSKANHPRISHIALKVKDVDQSSKVYQNVFGFEFWDCYRSGDHVSLHLNDGTIDLAFVTYDSEEDERMGAAAGTGPCIHHFGIDVDDTDAYVEKLKAYGCEILTDPSDPQSKSIKFRIPGGGGIAEIAPMGWHARKENP